MKPIGQAICEDHIQKIISRKPKTKARTYMQEITESYLPYINWQNETLEDDMKVFWSSASRLYAVKTNADYVKLLDWIKEKNSLYPKQVIKLLQKELPKKL